jgi:hypothetical protein
MATRTIVTSQPDVECDVCERRLLRGEQSDVFLGAGRRRIVCELCAPRAAHEGWMRETDSQSLMLPPMRPRRGRSLFERLPARALKGMPFRARQVAAPPGEPRADAGGLVVSSAAEQQAEPYDLFADAAPVREDPRGQTAHAGGAAHPEGHPPVAGVAGGQPAGAAPSQGEETNHDPQAALGHAAPVAARSETVAASRPPSEYVQHAVAVFNASEFPRRVAGVARSLGAPIVSVRSAEHLESVVSIVVAWELCWYRYEVDISEPVVEALLIAQGAELAELQREDRLANATAAESGLLVLDDA